MVLVLTRPLARAPLCVSHRGPPHPPLAACHVLHGTVSHWDDEGRWGENWIHFNGNAQMQSTWTIMGIPLFPDFAAALHVRKDLLYSCNKMAHNTTQHNKCAVFQRHDATPCLSSWTWMLWQIRQISEHRFKSAACEVSTAVSEAIIIIISAIIANPMMSCWQWWRGRSCMMSEAVKLDYPPPIGSSYSSSFPLPTLHTALYRNHFSALHCASVCCISISSIRLYLTFTDLHSDLLSPFIA